jgi:hypothetical protein
MTFKPRPKRLNFWMDGFLTRTSPRPGHLITMMGGNRCAIHPPYDLHKSMSWDVFDEYYSAGARTIRKPMV